MIISGKNSVTEALKSTVTINKIQLLKSAKDFKEIIELAKKRRVRFEFVERVVLDKQSKAHQGVIAETVDYKYCSLEEMLSKKQDNSIVIILDGIEDPHNFGAIIRVAECAGVIGIIMGKHRAVAVNETVIKTSAGAINNVPISKVTNLNQAIDTLKDEGFWVYGLESDGKNIYNFDLKGNIALVIGSEGSGLSRLTKEKCDGILALPLLGKVNSLNASVATGIAVYEVLRQGK